MTFSLRILLVAALAALVYGLATDDVRALLFGFLSMLIFLGLLHEVSVRRQNLAAIENMRADRERDWQWPDRRAA